MDLPPLPAPIGQHFIMASTCPKIIQNYWRIGLGVLCVIFGIVGAIFLHRSANLYSDLITERCECADGWQSPSIGSRGACSHHGGVVVRVEDHRTSAQKNELLCLKIIGAISLFTAFSAAVCALSEFPPTIPTIQIEGQKSQVPLTINHETKMVDVIFVDDRTYVTIEDVALVACPEGRRKSVYLSQINFRRVAETDKYRQDLSVWISTNRGCTGGYFATAMSWNPNFRDATWWDDANAENTQMKAA